MWASPVRGLHRTMKNNKKPAHQVTREFCFSDSDSLDFRFRVISYTFESAISHHFLIYTHFHVGESHWHRTGHVYRTTPK